MADTILGGTLYRESEFVKGLTGTCGPNASSMAQRWADQNASTPDTYAVYVRMRSKGRCGPDGASTLAALVADAQDARYHVDVLPYREPMPESAWRGFFNAHVGRHALVMETANGQALRDYLTNAGENARNLHYHFIMLAGWHPGGHSDRLGRDLPPGWFALDGDSLATPTGPTQLNAVQFYPDSVLAAAQPCAAMAIYPRVAIGPGATGGGGTPIVAWQQQPDKTGKDDKGHTCGEGDYNYLAAHNLVGVDGLMKETFYSADDSYLPLENGRIVTAHHDRVKGTWSVDEQGAQALVTVAAQLAAVQADLDQLKQSGGGAGGTADPVAQACIAAVQAQKTANAAMAAAIGEL